jgi:hypothetical protein
MTAFQLRPYRAEDEDAAIAVAETWRLAYPSIDFTPRVTGSASAGAKSWCRRLHHRRQQAGAGFVTIDRQAISTSWWSPRSLGIASATIGR